MNELYIRIWCSCGRKACCGRDNNEIRFSSEAGNLVTVGNNSPENKQIVSIPVCAGKKPLPNILFYFEFRLDSWYIINGVPSGIAKNAMPKQPPIIYLIEKGQTIASPLPLESEIKVDNITTLMFSERSPEERLCKVLFGGGKNANNLVNKFREEFSYVLEINPTDLINRYRNQNDNIIQKKQIYKYPLGHHLWMKSSKQIVDEQILKKFNIKVRAPVNKCSDDGIKASVEQSSASRKKRLADKYFDEGIRAFNNSDFKKAIEEFKKAVQLDPKLGVESNFNIGYCYCNLSKYEESIKYYQKSLKSKQLQNDQKKMIYNNIGIVYYKQMNYDKAIEFFGKAIQIDPNYFKAFYNRGFCYGIKKDYPNAIRDFNKALEIAPEPFFVLCALGEVYYYNNDLKSAQDCFKRALNFCPQSQDAYYFLGLIYNQQENYDMAIAYLNKAIECNQKEKDIDAYFERGNAYFSLKLFQSAIEDYTRIIEIDPDNANAYYYRGFAYGNKGEYYKAIEDYSKAIKLNPSDADAYYYRGYIYLNTKDYDKAIADCQNIIKINPIDVRGFRMLGVIYLKREKPNTALKYLLEAEKLGGDVYNNLGYAYLDVEKYNEALKYFQKDLQLKPENLDTLIGKAIALWRLTKSFESIECFKKVLELKPSFLEEGIQVLEKEGFFYSLKQKEAISEIIQELKKTNK